MARRKRNAKIRLSLGTKGRCLAAGIMMVLLIFLMAVLARRFAPLSNTDRQQFDAIIVLGTPADVDGNPTPTQLSAVTEAVHEYERGVAPRLIVTGGAVHGRYVEATVMARVAQAQGIPSSALWIEPRAHDTIQNACYSEHILAEHGLRSAEIVSSVSHLPRAALIFNRLPMEWRTHAAPALTAYAANADRAAEAVEILKTVRYLVWGRWMEGCTP